MQFGWNGKVLNPTSMNCFASTSLTFERWDFGKVENRLGVNIGSGVEFDIADNWMANIELKYKLVKDLDQAVFTLGVAYMFPAYLTRINEAKKLMAHFIPARFFASTL